MSDPIEVLDFWLGEIGPEGWYLGSPEIDDEIAHRFGALWDALDGGGLEHWIDGPAPTLAYLVVADQFSRNIHRGSARAFDTDARARDAAYRAIAAGWDLQAPAPERQFFYLPLEHSEKMRDQDEAVALMVQRMSEFPEQILHAKAHRAIIAKFGRFPFRNAALGRENTPEEQEFLDAGGYGAFVESFRTSHAANA